MNVTFLGTGAAMPTGDRFQSGLLLQGSGVEPLLVDCGSGVLHALERTDIGYEAVSTILLTHHHPDHVDDLIAILVARWLSGEPDATIVGPPGTTDLFDRLLDVHDHLRDRLSPEIREVDPGTFELCGYAIEATQTVHSAYCLAYRFETDDASFTFSADTEASEAVAELADGSAVLAHDCSFPDDVDVSNHPTPAQLGRVLADRDIGRVYLTHLYPHTEGRHAEMIESVESNFAGDVRIAHDGLTVSVSQTA